MTDVTPEETAPAAAEESAPADPASTPSEPTAPSTESPSPSDAPSEAATTATPDPDAGRVPREIPSIDPTVTQGNRVTVSTPNLQSDPIGDLKAKINEHFGNASHIVNDLRALADELATLLNKVATGL